MQKLTVAHILERFRNGLMHKSEACARLMLRPMTLAKKALAKPPVVVSDGCGSEWVKCDRPNCDLQVVRPGKVQCSCED